jgi:prepilin-type N-terminal cleavage/methylation domain-containing protein
MKIKMKQKNKTTKKRGFSIIEVVMSMAVISVGLLGIMDLMAKNVRTATDSRDEMIAAGLAQEGAELVLYEKNKGTVLSAGNICVSYNTGVTNSCAAFTLYKNASGFYTHSIATATKFQRRLIVVVNANDYTVTSFVSWNNSAPPIVAANCTITNKCVLSTLVIQK